MRLPDGTILMHAKMPYDPAKAHAYYLKTRRLQGRQRGAIPPAKSSHLKLVKPTFDVKVREGITVKLTSEQLKEQKAHADARVQSIKKKLGKLNAELKKRLAEARQAERESKKPDTAAEKSKAARDSAQYRDKHKQELKNKGKKTASGSTSDSKSKPDSVAELKKTIAGVQKSLAAAVDRQRSLNTAKKNG